MTGRFVAEWNPSDIDDGVTFCKNPQYNLSFPEYDGFILHCMVRTFYPSRIIELGSGMSTRVMINASRINDNNVNITCVDKYASAETKSALGSLDCAYLDEDITDISTDIFKKLDRNDILFIDSSHVLKNFGDVEFEFMEILPRLKSGVIVHVHDIFLPFNYPIQWLVDWKCVLTEQHILGAYLHDNKRVKILSANHYNLIRNIGVPDKIEHRSGGSLWFQIL